MPFISGSLSGETEISIEIVLHQPPSNIMHVGLIAQFQSTATQHNNTSLSLPPHLEEASLLRLRVSRITQSSQNGLLFIPRHAPSRVSEELARHPIWPPPPPPSHLLNIDQRRPIHRGVGFKVSRWNVHSHCIQVCRRPSTCLPLLSICLCPIIRLLLLLLLVV